MKLLKNMMWMAGGVGVGYLVSTNSKSMKKLFKKGKKEVNKVMNSASNSKSN